VGLIYGGWRLGSRVVGEVSTLGVFQCPLGLLHVDASPKYLPLRLVLILGVFAHGVADLLQTGHYLLRELVDEDGEDDRHYGYDVVLPVESEVTTDLVPDRSVGGTADPVSEVVVVDSRAHTASKSANNSRISGSGTADWGHMVLSDGAGSRSRLLLHLLGRRDAGLAPHSSLRCCLSPAPRPAAAAL